MDGTCPDVNKSSPKRIYLLSPANAGGPRGKMLLNADARFDLAQRFQREGLPISELFTFISGLYFRGKVAYAETFCAAPENAHGTLVITACWGLQPLNKLIRHNDLNEMIQVPIEPGNPVYRLPLEREARDLHQRVGADCEIVLLGSIASPKYVEPLLPIFGERLLFPAEFVGRGDMSRGGLMLRHARSGVRLKYISVATPSGVDPVLPGYRSL